MSTSPTSKIDLTLCNVSLQRKPQIILFPNEIKNRTGKRNREKSLHRAHSSCAVLQRTVSLVLINSYYVRAEPCSIPQRPRGLSLSYIQHWAQRQDSERGSGGRTKEETKLGNMEENLFLNRNSSPKKESVNTTSSVNTLQHSSVLQYSVLYQPET